jgi:hypothetical protein
MDEEIRSNGTSKTAKIVDQRNWPKTSISFADA